MLTILISDTEQFNENTNTFEIRKGCVLTLEHSLVSISKWEAKHTKPFLGNDKKTSDEMLDYVKCMIIKSSIKDFVLTHSNFTEKLVKEISNYISHPMTATTFNKQNGSRNKEIVTSELIYYWMISQQIPFECQYWHLNRLLTLINVCAIKNAPPKKMGRKELLSRNAQLNAERKKQLNTTG